MAGLFYRAGPPSRHTEIIGPVRWAHLEGVLPKGCLWLQVVSSDLIRWVWYGRMFSRRVNNKNVSQRPANPCRLHHQFQDSGDAARWFQNDPRQQKTHVLNGRNQIVLNLLPPKPSPPRSLEPMVVGRIGKAAFHQMLPALTIPLAAALCDCARHSSNASACSCRLIVRAVLERVHWARSAQPAQWMPIICQIRSWPIRVCSKFSLEKWFWATRPQDAPLKMSGACLISIRSHPGDMVLLCGESFFGVQAEEFRSADDRSVSSVVNVVSRGSGREVLPRLRRFVCALHYTNGLPIPK
jgi:hypothetical protein